jgi:hypothetical protein
VGEKSNVDSCQLRKTFFDLAIIEMVSSTLHASVPSQPASYDHMEQVLSQAISKPGEYTQEVTTGGQSNSSQETPEGAGLASHKNGATASSNAPQHEFDTQQAANPILPKPTFGGPIQERAPSKSGENQAQECSSVSIAPQTGSSPKACVTSNSQPCEEPGNEKIELRPLVPSPMAVVPVSEPALASTPFEKVSRSTSSTPELSKVRQLCRPVHTWLCYLQVKSARKNETKP